MNAIKIIDYNDDHQPFFEQYNKAWIQENFELEPVDLFVLTNPREAILASGGAILMALYNDEVAGTAGLKKAGERTFEFTKMAVDPRFRNKGIGEALTKASIHKAKELGATEIILYSNTIQAAAIRLYERIGFIYLPVENDVYHRANVKMRLDVF